MSEHLWKIAADIRRSMRSYEQQLDHALTQRHIPAYRDIDVQRCAMNIAKRAEAIAALAQGTEAQRAETVKQGSVHDGPVGDSRCAPPSPSQPSKE